jgi:DNA-binding MarR family transcriptional regulator
MSMGAGSTGAATERLTSVELAAWRGFLRAHAQMIRALDADLESEHGLPLSSYEVLLFLESAPGRRMRMSELASRVLLSRSGVTRLVDRLVREGLIERASCPSDARGSFAVLTDRGLARLHEARPTHLAGVRRRFLDRFDEDERELLGRLWDRVLDAGSAPGSC